MNLLSETFLPSFNNLHVSVKINPSAYPNWFRSVQNHHSFWPFDQNKNNARFHYQVKQSQILQTTSSTTNSSQRQHNHRNMSSQSNQQQETSRERLMRLLSEGKIETTQQRMERLQEQGYDRDKVISFSIRVTKKHCYMDTEQYNGPDLVEWGCNNFEQLFVVLFAEWREYMEAAIEVYKNAPPPPVGTYRHFLMRPDATPKEFQEPFVLIEYIDYDTPKQRTKYFINLAEFMDTMNPSAT